MRSRNLWGKPDLHGVSAPRVPYATSIGAWAYYPATANLRGLPRGKQLDTFGGDFRVVFKRKKGGYRVARELARVGPRTRDLRCDGSRIKVAIRKPPRDLSQARVRDQMVSRLEAGESFTLCAPPAFGKTYLGCAAVEAVQRHTLVVVPNSVLVRQWQKAFKRFLGLSDEEIGLIQGDVCRTEGTKVVIGMLQTLSRRNRRPEDYLKTPGLVIFDEVHRLGARHFSRVGPLFPARLRLGLSATPYRVDGRHDLFMAHIGPVAVQTQESNVSPKVALIDSGWLVPPVPHDFGDISILLRVLTRNAKRNALLAYWVDTLYTKGRRIMVLSERKEHLHALSTLCKVPEKDKAFFYAGLKKDHYRSAVKKRVLFGTYQFSGTGLDLPEFDSLIMASPLAHVRQAVGRILREHPNKQRPVVIDIVDEGSFVLDGYLQGRMKHYGKMNAEIL